MLQKATNAKQANEEAKELELIKLAVASAKLAGEGTITKENLESELKINFNDNIITISEIEDGWSYNSYKIYKNGEVDKLLPKGYQQVEYIESTGIEYIDTGIIPQNGFGFWIDVMPLTEISKNAMSSKIFGTSKKNNGHWGGVELATYPVNPTGQLSWFEKNAVYDPGFQSYTRCQMSDINNIFESSTGKKYNTPFITNSEIAGNLYLFAINTEEGVYANGLGTRLYGCKLYDNGEIVRNFIPCYSTTSVIDVDVVEQPKDTVGLYDLVEGKFYTNANTAESAVDFTPGPEV